MKKSTTKWTTRSVRALYRKGELSTAKAILLMVDVLRFSGIGEDGIEAMARSMLS